MTTHTLTIANWHPPRLNQCFGRHWRTAHRLKTATTDILAAEAHNQNVPQATGKRRVALHLYGWRRGVMPDLDAFSKLLCDSLKRAGLLVDDSPTWLDGLVQVTLTRSAEKKTVLILEEVC